MTFFYRIKLTKNIKQTVICIEKRNWNEEVSIQKKKKMFKDNCLTHCSRRRKVKKKCPYDRNNKGLRENWTKITEII